MGIDLLTLEPQKISKNLKGKFIMVYGLPGVGKTTLGAQFPKALVLGFECGTNALNNIYVQPIKTWQDWKQAANQLIKKKEQLQDKFENIILDTVDSMWDLCVKYICSNNGVERLGDLPWGQGYDIAKQEFQNLLRELTFAGYGVVFISHSAEKTFKDENGEEFTQITVALPNRPYEIVNKMVDIIGYIRQIKQEDGESKRFIFFRGNDNFFAKSRFRYIVPKVEFSYDNIVNAIYEAIDKEVENSGGEASEDENPYWKRTFEDLMEEAKAVWTKVIQKEKGKEASEILEKTFGKPTKFSEITESDKDKLEIVLSEIQEIV